MKKRASKRSSVFPGLFDGKAMRRARTLREFDNVVRAAAWIPRYRRLLDARERETGARTIAVPTLLLNAS